MVAAGTVVGTSLLGASLATEPDSRLFYRLTVSTAAAWTVGGLASGPLRLGRSPGRGGRPVLVPVLVGVGAFAVFYGCALVSRHVPVLNRAIGSVLRYAHRGSGPLVLATTLANGAAEEIFFRGALYTALGGRRPVARSTAVYALVTCATRNPSLVLASVVMGALFGWQRRVTGGVQAPVITHLTWSALMLWLLPPLFPHRSDDQRDETALPDRAPLCQEL